MRDFSKVSLQRGYNMLKDLAEVATKLIPPHDADPEKIYRWRVYAAGAIILMATGLTTHIALACGFIPTLFSGFASAADMQTMTLQQQVLRAEILGDTLYNMQKDQCLARSTGNLAAAQTQDQRIREKRAAYRVITQGRDYELPPCDLFVSR